MRRCLLSIVVFSILASPALAETGHHAGLRQYVRKVTPVIQAYRSVAKRAGNLLSEQPTEDVGPLVDGLARISSDFERLNARWNTIKAPPGLGLKHRGMGGAFPLQSRYFAAVAEAWQQFQQSGDVVLLHDAIDKAGGLLHSAAHLQKRWAAALSGALIRAYVPVPRWLEQMATIVP